MDNTTDNTNASTPSSASSSDSFAHSVTLPEPDLSGLSQEDASRRAAAHEVAKMDMANRPLEVTDFLQVRPRYDGMSESEKAARYSVDAQQAYAGYDVFNGMELTEIIKMLPPEEYRRAKLEVARILDAQERGGK